MISPKRIGIFGGTFDPPHIGHQILAAEAADQLGLEKVLWVLTPNPPHKRGQKITPLEVRLQMVQAAIASNPIFVLSRVDIDRQPPHYAVDTVLLLREQYPKAELVYLIGGDSLRNLPSWHEPQQFVDACGALGVMCRPGDQADLWGLDSIIYGIAEKVEFIDAPLLEISSSQIRRRIREGRMFRYYVPREVEEIIRERGVYKVRDERGDIRD